MTSDSSIPRSAIRVLRSRVLIVDDEESIRQTLAEFVRDGGYEVFTAQDAPEALRILESDAPDVVITDLILPRINGVELLHRIKELSAETQVVMLTGEPTVETASEAVREGAFDYLSKPISRASLLSTVTSAVRVKKLSDERLRLQQENIRYREHLEEQVAAKTQELRESEERYRSIVEHSHSGILIVDEAYRFSYVNERLGEILGTSADELLGQDFRTFLDEASLELVSDRYLRRRRGEDVPSSYECTAVRKDGQKRRLELSATLIRSSSGASQTIAQVLDITDRKRAEEAAGRLLEQQVLINRLAIKLGETLELNEIYRLVYEQVRSVMDVSGFSVSFFDSASGLITAGHAVMENVERDVAAFPPVPLEDEGRGAQSRVIRSGEPFYTPDLREAIKSVGTEHTIARDGAVRDGPPPEGIEESTRSALCVPMKIEGEVIGVMQAQSFRPDAYTTTDQGFLSGLASVAAVAIQNAYLHQETKQAADALRQSENRYRVLFESSPSALFYDDFSDVKAFIDELKASGVTDMEAYLTHSPEVVDECIERVRVIDVNEASLELHGATRKEELLGGLTPILTREARRTFIQQLVTIADGGTYFATTTLDQTLAGAPKHVALRWSVLPGHEETFDKVLVAKLDVSAVVEAECAVRESLDGTMAAIGLTTEMRDPYTAGHQRRMTELAVAIAHELGLDEATTDGVKAAGMMHDIGKMAVPAEILTKPSALSEMERTLIRAHSQAACDILKTVTLPWPVAEIVLQHHERLDGSGYPRGLRGDDLLIEARILAVADVVEAMASHRPYRAALGIDAALEEISKNKGTLYDPDVVDACIHLFKEEGFKFSA